MMQDAVIVLGILILLGTAALLIFHPTVATEVYDYVVYVLLVVGEFIEWCISKVIEATRVRTSSGAHRPGPGRYLASDRQHVREVIRA